jgi:hypothetical protein
MRPLFAIGALFVYVCADITVNNGAALRGWFGMVSSVVRSVGVFG